MQIKFEHLGVKNAIIGYLIFTAFVAGVCVGLPFLFPNSELFIQKFWVVFCFVSGITLIALVVALIGIQRKPDVGVMAIMGSIVVKLLFTMAFLLVYILKIPVNGNVFLVNFFSLYFLFSGFEIYALLRNLRHPIKK